MEIVNTTAVAGHLVVGPAARHPGAKEGCLTAKATFSVDRAGQVSVDSDTAFEIFPGDVETPLGVLPSDLPVRRGSAFEVVLLGAAYVPHGGTVTESTVTLRAGERSQTLRVVGDRRWVEGPHGAVLSEPQPFARMPLTWERAFGGSAQVWLDDRSATQVNHALNPRGRGFDPTPDVARLAEAVFTAPGFPRTDYTRLAPNLEAPDAPVTSPNDAPDPVCFATVPVDCGLAARDYGGQLQRDPNERAPLTELVVRAPPGWVLESAPLGRPVSVTGCQPDGDFSFVLPSTLPEMDYVLGERTGSRALTPQLLVILPEERAFYIVYRHFFLMRIAEGEERSLRLRFG